MNPSCNSLNGKHLRVKWSTLKIGLHYICYQIVSKPGWSGNPKGLPGPLKGGVILECLTSRFNFTYEMMRINDSSLEPQGNKKGLFNYLWDQVECRPNGFLTLKDFECDLLLQDVVPSYRYHKLIDITVPWVYTSSAILMPVPVDSSFNINALIKPFQWPIWLGVGISIVCVIFVLKFLQRYQEKLFESASNHGDGVRLAHKERTGKQYLYVFGNLMSQGGPCSSKRLPFRIVAGIWTLAAFIFVQAYNSTLFTYLVTPMKHSLINSPYDIPESKEVRLLVKKGSPMDTALSIKNNTNEFNRKLGERVDYYPDSRCYPVSQCISMLTPGSNNVYLDAFNYHKDIIRAEFKKTKKCNLQLLAKEGFSTVMGSFALPKHTEYTKTVNQGLLEIMQAGLVDYWDVWFRPMPPQCQGNIKSVNPPNTKALKTNNKSPALTLRNLTGAFIVLCFGLGVSCLVFLCELITSLLNRPNRLMQETRINSVEIALSSQDNSPVQSSTKPQIARSNSLKMSPQSIPRTSM
ncbi:hypothetical protein DAPPUDRAFT_312495 [Daphnia pulex]|uniref:Ionotropic glutamate receptor C-terminal domain-containing protein n=1 Tax=Daphnia pulex TaxID=6669 RepID=E9FZ78_DAPPU|nr:hypothetical protein DAPPUDRAFT_312495 [Daphnia pulex]|eukprot:EFX87007.1 hypothetical protein DAPPUDRAFT_312495 [Daphnia pulex]